MSSDIRHSIRKLEFPQSAKEALVRIEQLLIGRVAPSNKQFELAMEIISEFIFLESDRRSNRRSGLNPLQELMLIDVICDYLSGTMNEMTKNTIFLSLFGGTESPRRMKVLCTLASMAVSASNTAMCLAVGTWLQQTGCSSPLALQLAESLVQDHFHLQTGNTSFNQLASQAPQFLANFMATVTELYLHNDNKLPPKNLLEVITDLVCSDPRLCMSAQLTPLTLPTGAIPMAAVTPLAGLVRWCALSPLHITTDVEMEEVTPVPVKKIKLEDSKEPSKRTAPSATEAELYRRLHLGVLSSLRAGRRSHGAPTAVSAQQLSAIASAAHAEALRLTQQCVKLATHGPFQECLDRIAQATQVALANGCLYGNIPNLLATLKTLPENRLLRIVIKTHQLSI